MQALTSTGCGMLRGIIESHLRQRNYIQDTYIFLIIVHFWEIILCSSLIFHGENVLNVTTCFSPDDL